MTKKCYNSKTTTMVDARVAEDHVLFPALHSHRAGTESFLLLDVQIVGFTFSFGEPSNQKINAKNKDRVFAKILVTTSRGYRIQRKNI